MKTNELRELVKSKLDALKIKNVKEIYYETASDNAMYPHVVFTLSSVSTLSNDNNRRDYILEIDVWNKNSRAVVCDLSDEIEQIFNNANIPKGGIYPTFYLESRISVADSDKDIKHELIKFKVQLYA